MFQSTMLPAQLFSQKVQRRLFWLAVALSIQLILLLILSYNPHAWADVYNSSYWPLKKNTEPTQTLRTLRKRPWMERNSKAPRSLCDDGGRLPNPRELAPIAQNGGRGALVFPSINGMRGWRGQEAFADKTSICAWMVIVDWGDAAAEVPFFNNSVSLEESTLPQPLPSWPPDSVEILAVGENFTVPIQMGRQHIVVRGSNPKKVNYRVYNCTLDIQDHDTFRLDVTLEYKDYLWNYESSDHVFWSPNRLPVYVNRYALRHVPSFRLTTNPSTHPPLTADRYMKLPTCTTGNHAGRWVPLSHLAPTTVMEMQAENSAQFDGPMAIASYTSMVWLPYACRYLAATYASFRESCLKTRHPYIHMFGDSNIRRSIKALASDGKWCKVWNDESNSKCQCTDFWLGIEGLQADRADNLLRLPAGNKSPQTDDSLFAYVYLWKGLNDWGPDWRTGVDTPHLYDRIKGINAKLAERRPSVAIISLVNWDAAYGNFSTFTLAMSELISALNATYAKNGIPIIWRSGQFFSGRADVSEGKNRRRFSRLRIMAFNEFAEKALVEAFDAKVWDVHALGEGLDETHRINNLQCISGHSSRDVVDVENQILLNMLCPADGSR